MTKKTKPSEMKRILLGHRISEIRQGREALNLSLIVASILSVYAIWLGQFLTWGALFGIALFCLCLRYHYKVKEQYLIKELEKI